MPTPLYCWRCSAIIPMLAPEEWEQIAPLLSSTVERIRDLRRNERLDLHAATHRAQGELLERYFELTGYRERNWLAIYHHRSSDFGSPCATCGKPLRTPRAKHCAECGAWR